jgi:hypothetical protein
MIKKPALIPRKNCLLNHRIFPHLVHEHSKQGYFTSIVPNQAEGPPHVGCLRLFTAATFHIGGRFSICNLRMPHAVVTGILMSWAGKTVTFNHTF